MLNDILIQCLYTCAYLLIDYSETSFYKWYQSLARPDFWRNPLSQPYDRRSLCFQCITQFFILVHQCHSERCWCDVAEVQTHNLLHLKQILYHSATVGSAFKVSIPYWSDYLITWLHQLRREILKITFDYIKIPIKILQVRLSLPADLKEYATNHLIWGINCEWNEIDGVYWS